MKAQNFYLISDQVRRNAVQAINSTVLDGKTKVSVGSAGTKSQRQRGLQWIWYGDVSKAGIGGEMEESRAVDDWDGFKAGYMFNKNEHAEEYDE